MRRLCLIVILLILINIIFALKKCTTHKCLLFLNKYNPGGQYVVLTISGGPSKKFANEILSLFNEIDILATFFIPDKRVYLFPELISNISNRGHQVSLLYTESLISNDGILIKDHLNNLQKTLYNFNKVLRQNSSFVRVPFDRLLPNLLNEEYQNVQYMQKIQFISWSKDFPYINSQNFSISCITPGDIILFKESDFQHLTKIKSFLIELLNNGYEFLTIEQMKIFPDDSPH